MIHLLGELVLVNEAWKVYRSGSDSERFVLTDRDDEELYDFVIAGFVPDDLRATQGTPPGEGVRCGVDLGGVKDLPLLDLIEVIARVAFEAYHRGFEAGKQIGSRLTLASPAPWA